MFELFEWLIDCIFDIYDAARKGDVERNQEFAMKLLPVLLFLFLAVFLGIIWILEGGWS
ncbi:MAG: hypothetical protein IJA49_02915 [Oscillospiraceae bacterium]|nr:hypothetical protein [Oscillospiraceae bacterium]